MAEINANHADLLGGDGVQEEKQGTDAEGDSGEERGFGFAIFTLIDYVIQFTHLNIKEIYNMVADEFFSYVDYIRAREKRKADEVKRIQRQ